MIEQLCCDPTGRRCVIRSAAASILMKQAPLHMHTCLVQHHTCLVQHHTCLAMTFSAVCELVQRAHATARLCWPGTVVAVESDMTSAAGRRRLFSRVCRRCVAAVPAGRAETAAVSSARRTGDRGGALREPLPAPHPRPSPGAWPVRTQAPFLIPLSCFLVVLQSFRHP